MASQRALRPRVLSAGFGAYFLIMALVAWYSGQNLGYHYAPDVTRFSFMVFLIVGAIFLVGVGVAAVLGARSLDTRIEHLEARGASDESVVEEIVVEEPIPDQVPPPLVENPGTSGDHVDRDIDELLVSLQEMEEDAGTEEEAGAPKPAPKVAPRVAVPSRALTQGDTRRLSLLRKKRDGIGAYFAGPALASIGAIGISAAMLPGTDAFLQTYYQLNTALLLGLAYTFVGIAAYIATSALLLVRNK